LEILKPHQGPLKFAMEVSTCRLILRMTHRTCCHVYARVFRVYSLVVVARLGVAQLQHLVSRGGSYNSVFTPLDMDVAFDAEVFACGAPACPEAQ
jgi:hypothetical protein